MAWTHEEKFNSDTKSIGDLNGQDSWTGDVDYDITNSTSYEGDQSVTQTNGNGTITYTLGADVATGILYVAMRANSTMISSDDSTFQLHDTAGNVRVLVGFTGGAVKYGSSSVLTSLFTPTALQWYLIEIELIAGGNYKLRYNDGSSWSSQTASLSPYTGAGLDVRSIKLNSGAGGGQSWFDYISPTDPTIATGTSALVTADAEFFSTYGGVQKIMRWYPNGEGTINSVLQTGHTGNIYTIVKYLPRLSIVRDLTIYCAPTSTTGSTVIATLKLYFNQSSTVGMTKSITKDMASRGYVTVDINRPNTNAVQIEIEHNTTDALGADEFMPSVAILDYDPTTTHTPSKD